MGIDMNEDAVCDCRLTSGIVEGDDVTIVELLFLNKVTPALGQDIGVAGSPEAEAELPDQPSCGILEGEDMVTPITLVLGDFGEVLLGILLGYEETVRLSNIARSQDLAK